jgi:hypothetical protein
MVMRGTVAKCLRRRAFVLSAKEPTVGKVRWHEKVFKVKNEEGENVEKKVRHGTYYLEGYRKVYQNLKKEYKHGKST